MHSSPLIAVPPCTPQAPNQAKLVAAIEVRDLEALREALAAIASPDPNPDANPDANPDPNS